MIRAPFFLLVGFNRGPQKLKGQRGTTGEPCLFKLAYTVSALWFRGSGSGFGLGGFPAQGLAKTPLDLPGTSNMGLRIRGTLEDIDPLKKLPFKRARSRVQKGPL